MSRMIVQLRARDQGKPMSLADFQHAESADGRVFELSRGVVVSMEVPNPPHLRPLISLKRLVHAYDSTHPGRIHAILGGQECKILVDEWESERHPDLAIYLTPVPERDDSSVWREWIPEIVVEIVSLGSELRDYEEKREEYLAIGVREYWIVDVEKQELHVLKRWGGQWRKKVLRPGDTCTTRLLPGFAMPVADVLESA